jgi:hypothetical protein
MRREPDAYADQELTLVFIARRLKIARNVERKFDASALDYVVIPTPYTTGLLFRSQRIGAFFYVIPGLAERARSLVAECGYEPFDES